MRNSQNRFKFDKIILLILIVLSSISSQIFAQEYNVIWNKLDNADFDPLHFVITKKEKSGWGNCGAISYNVLKPNQNGYVKHTVSDLKNQNIFGLSTYNEDNRPGTIDYSFYKNQNQILILEHGKILGNYGKLNAGDVLEIKRELSKIIYLRNGKELRVISTNPNYQLYVDVILYDFMSLFKNIKTSFKGVIDLSYTKQDVDCSQYEGNINLIIKGGKPPFDILWNTGDTSKSLQNLSIGNYSVSVKDITGEFVMEKMDINAIVDWVLDKGLIINDNKLYKVTPNGWEYESTGYSNNVLEADNDGFIEIEIDDYKSTKAFGLSTKKAQITIKDIDHCFLISKENLLIYKNGELLGVYGKVTKGTKLRILKKGSAILYIKNDNVVRKENISSPKDYYINVNIYSEGAFFEPISTNFCPKSLSVIWDIHHVSRKSMGWINLKVSKGTPPYKYTWDNGSILNPHYNLEPGVHSVTITDSKGSKYQKEKYVLSSVYWDKLIGVQDYDGRLIKFFKENLWNAGASSKNILRSKENGLIRYTLKSLTGEKAFGLSLVDNITAISEMKYAIVFMEKKAYIQESGVNVKEIGYFSKGDEYEIYKEDGKIKYIINSKLVYESKISDDEFILDVALFTPKAEFENIQVSFTNYPFIIINTNDLDPNFTYTIKNRRLNETRKLGTTESFFIDRITKEHEPFELTIYADKKLKLRFNYSKEYDISKLEYSVNENNYATYHQNLYQASKNKLVLYIDEIIENDFIGYTSIFPNLEDGLLMSPNGDGKFDLLRIEGLKDVRTYSIKIFTINDELVYSSYNKTVNWDGKNMNTNKIVAQGTYIYKIIADGIKFNGQFLIEY